jgi:cysteine desulfurase/selenocysteine lyase
MSTSSMTFDQLRQDLPLTQKVAYFQSGGHGPTPDSVIKVVHDNMIYLNHNGYPVPETRQVLEERENSVRRQLSDFLNVKTAELAWTPNTSQAIQQILHSIHWQPGDEFVISSAEHITTKRAGQALEEYYGAVVKTIPADEGDETLLEALQLVLTERTRLVCLSQVTTLDGRRLPISEAASIAHQQGVPVMVDGAQSLGQYLVDVTALGCDFFVGSGHKWLLGPRGLGFIWVAPERIPGFRPGFIPDHDLWLEPGEPRPPITAATRVELGTCDLAKRIGLGRAVEIMTSLGLDRIEAHVVQLANDLVREVEQWPGAKIVTPEEPGRASGLLAVTFDGYDEPRLCNLIAELMQKRIVVKFQPELTAMRISIASFNNTDEVGRLLDTLKNLILS